MAKSQIKYIPKQPQPKMQAPKVEMPEVIDSKNTSCDQMFWGVLIGGELLACALVYVGVKNVIDALHPINWMQIVFAAVLAVFGLITAAGSLRAAFVMAVMMAARTMSYEACARYCNQAIRYRQLIPGGVAWAVQSLLEFKIQNQAYDEVIEVGTREFDLAMARNPKENSLGSICVCIGHAYSTKNDNHKAIEWLEKGVNQYKLMFANLEKDKKTAKIPGGADNIYMRYAESYLGLSRAYLMVQDKRNAKDRVSNVFEIAKKVKDCPEKEMILKSATEINKHLKHW